MAQTQCTLPRTEQEAEVFKVEQQVLRDVHTRMIKEVIVYKSKAEVDEHKSYIGMCQYPTNVLFPKNFGLFLSISECSLKIRRSKELLDIAKRGGLADLSITWSDTEIEGGSYKFLRTVIPVIPKITKSLWISHFYLTEQKTTKILISCRQLPEITLWKCMIDPISKSYNLNLRSSLAKICFIHCSSPERRQTANYLMLKSIIRFLSEVSLREGLKEIVTDTEFDKDEMDELDKEFRKGGKKGCIKYEF
ncbi:unnamed protein product [Moneuplotes crassus]|uniref:Uncharacterized protein n=1 Tax=Euplotes crassus TaxID=5936 RepID=A0AAD1XPC9_EUPCR|nr:unnamed protein product [Moneuplotes crassus]